MRWPRAEWTAVLGCGIGAVIALGVALQQPTTYAAETRVLIRTPETERLFAPTGTDVPQSRSTAAELEFGRGDEVADAAAGTSDSGEHFSVSVNVSTDFGPDDAGVLVFRASANTSDRAVHWADAYASAYITVRQQRDGRQVTQRRDQLSVSLVELETRLAATNDETDRSELMQRRADLIGEIDSLDDSILQLTKDGANAFVVQRATEPSRSIQASILQTVLIGALLGLLTSLGLRSWFAERDTTTS